MKVGDWCLVELLHDSPIGPVTKEVADIMKGIL
jgi:hypothetical protein